MAVQAQFQVEQTAVIQALVASLRYPAAAKALIKVLVRGEVQRAVAVGLQHHQRRARQAFLHRLLVLVLLVAQTLAITAVAVVVQVQ